MENYNRDIVPIKREQTVMDSEYIPVEKEKIESNKDQKYIEEVAIKVREGRMSGKIPQTYIDELLVQNKINPSSADAEEFMNKWDLEAARRTIHEGTLRKDAYDEIKRSFAERIQHNPIATTEELDAGVYQEDLEPQVKDAVMTLRRKGYATFESGFNNPITSPQYMGFYKEDGIEVARHVNELNRHLHEKGIMMELRESNDRYTMLLIPDHIVSLEEWKAVWDQIAEILPDRGESATPSTVYAAAWFRENQEKLQEGKDAYLGNDWFYKDGKVVKKER